MFRKNNKDGYGVLTLSSGEMYEGTWSVGSLNGSGIRTRVDGSKVLERYRCAGLISTTTGNVNVIICGVLLNRMTGTAI